MASAPTSFAQPRQLFKIDPDRVRATCVWGIVLKDEGRLDAAEKVFRNFMIEHGEEGSVLTNLAKVYSRRKKDGQAEEILWHALEVDPNQENGLGWYLVHSQRTRRRGRRLGSAAPRGRSYRGVGGRSSGSRETLSPGATFRPQ